MIVANWKENPETEADALKLFAAEIKIPRDGAAGRGTVDVVICPPFVYLEEIAKIFRAMPARATAHDKSSKKHLAIGAQDIFWEHTGAFTGEIGPGMLKSLGGTYAIIGHSERRKFLNETDEMVNKKAVAALEARLKIILCVGEPLAVRRQGFLYSKKYVKAQLEKDLKGVERITKDKRRIAIAYEPIWAIGTGKNCPPIDAVEMAKLIKKVAQAEYAAPPAAVLYGGSVNGKDAREYLSRKEIDGALVGGASLRPEEFAKICRAAI